MSNIKLRELHDLLICADCMTMCEYVLDRDVYVCGYFDPPPNVNIEYIDIKGFKDSFITHLTIYLSIRSFTTFRDWADKKGIKRGSV